MFFFNDTATTEIYTLSLHDALPISGDVEPALVHGGVVALAQQCAVVAGRRPTVGPMDDVVHVAPGGRRRAAGEHARSEEHTSELQSRQYLVCRLLLEKTTK